MGTANWQCILFKTMDYFICKNHFHDNKKHEHNVNIFLIHPARLGIFKDM